MQEELDLLGVVQVGVPVLANTLDRSRIGGGGVGVAVPEKIPVAAVKAARTVVGPAVDTHQDMRRGWRTRGIRDRHTGKEPGLQPGTYTQRHCQQEHGRADHAAPAAFVSVEKHGDAGRNHKNQRGLVHHSGHREKHQRQYQPARLAAFYKAQHTIAAPQHHGWGRQRTVHERRIHRDRHEQQAKHCTKYLGARFGTKLLSDAAKRRQAGPGG